MGKANKLSANSSETKGGKVTGTLGADGRSTEVKIKNEKSGHAGETIKTNTLFAIDSPENGHTFATLIAVRDKKGNIHNTNGDIVVVHTVGVSGVESPTTTIDAVGSSCDKDDFLISTFEANALDTKESPDDGTTRGGTTFKANRRIEVTVKGACKAPTTDGCTFYLTPTETSIDEGVGITARGEKQTSGPLDKDKIHAVNIHSCPFAETALGKGSTAPDVNGKEHTDTGIGTGAIRPGTVDEERKVVAEV